MLIQRKNLHGICGRIAVVVFVLSAIVTPAAHAGESSAPSFEQGEPVGAGFIGKPVSLLTGAETFVRTDLRLGRFFPIVLQRRYHSGVEHISPLGYGWAHNYDRHLHEYTGGAVEIHKETGWKRRFELSGGAYVTPPGEFGTLVKNADNSFTYTLKDGSREEYNTLGQLAQIVKPGGTPLLILTYGAPLPSGNRLTKVAEHIRQSDNTIVPTGVFIDFIYNETTGRLISVADSLSRTVIYEHNDGNGNLTGVSGPGVVASYGYTDTSYPHALTNIDEGKGEYVNNYDTQGRVESQTHGTGVIDIEYLIAGQKTKATTRIKDSAGNLLNTQTRTVEFDSYGQPSKATDTFGHEVRTVRNNSQGLIDREEYWENSGTVTAPVLALKNTTEFTYNMNTGNMLTKTEAKGKNVERTTTWTYHPTFGTVWTETRKSVIDPAQDTVITHIYDPVTGKRSTTTEAGLLGSGMPYSYITTYGYNDQGQLTSIDGPLTTVSDVTTLTYDAVTGFLTSITRPLIGTTTFSDHDPLGNPRTVTDPNNQQTLYTFDDLGRVTSVQEAGLTSATRYYYVSECDCIDRLDYLLRPNGSKIDFDYDENGNLVKVTEDSLGSSINYQYDSQGNRLAVEFKNSTGTQLYLVNLSYDELNRVKRITDFNTNYSEYTYDFASQRIGVRNPRGNSTAYRYDPLGRLNLVTQPGDIETALGYAGNDSLASLTDGNGAQTTFNVDDRERVYRTTSHDTGWAAYSYDAAGNLTRKVTADNVTTNYTYDAANRLKKIDFANDPDVVLSYDNDVDCRNSLGRLCTISDGTRKTTYHYLPRGLVEEEVSVVDGVTLTTQYSYNSSNYPDSITYPSGRVVTYTYTLRNTVSSVTTTINGVTTTLASSITFKPFGDLQGLNYGNGLTGAVVYDKLYRPTRITTSGGKQDLSYIYDANSNVDTITNALDATRNKNFDYDDLDRLTSESSVLGSRTYGYDNVGNRLNQGTTIYTYVPGSNRLSSVGATQYTYDDNGNTLSDGVRTYVYNDNQRLEQMNKGTDTAIYSYNGLGQKVKKVVNGATTLYCYDLAGRLIAETDAAGATVTEYVYINDRPLAMIRAGATYWYHTDHLGTPQMLTDGAGNVVWNVDYWAFGSAVAVGTNPVSSRPRLPGQVADGESGLYYNYFRDYSPGIGRYIEADPIGLRGGVNPYAYVQNNPVNFIDPMGLFGEAGWFGTRPTGESNTTGFQGSNEFFSGEEGPVMNFVDNYVPGFHSYSSVFHDPIVDGMTKVGGGSGANAFSLMATVLAVPGFAVYDTFYDIFGSDNQGCH